MTGSSAAGSSGSSATTRRAPEKGGTRKSRAAMPQAWLEDTRKAWERGANAALERAGRGERIDHRSLAERRDVAERSGDLERAAELSRKPNVHLGPQALRELPGGRNRLFIRRPSGWRRTIRRWSRSGTAL